MNDGVGELVVFEPSTKTPQSLSHELENEANVSSIGALELKIINKVACVGVAKLLFISVIAQVFEDFPLKNRVVFSVAFCTQHLESAKSMLVTFPNVLLQVNGHVAVWG